MNAKELREWIDRLTDDIEFRYNGVWGSICPFSRENISVSYGEKEKTFSSINEVMDDTSVIGRPIKEACKDFEL